MYLALVLIITSVRFVVAMTPFLMFLCYLMSPTHIVFFHYNDWQVARRVSKILLDISETKIQSFARNKVKMFYLKHPSKLRYYLPQALINLYRKHYILKWHIILQLHTHKPKTTKICICIKMTKYSIKICNLYDFKYQYF